MLDGISNFEWKKGGKLGQLPAPSVHQDLVAFNVWHQFVQKPLRKTP
jgi:hypothetical protein